MIFIIWSQLIDGSFIDFAFGNFQLDTSEKINPSSFLKLSDDQTIDRCKVGEPLCCAGLNTHNPNGELENHPLPYPNSEWVDDTEQVL